MFSTKLFSFLICATISFFAISKRPSFWILVFNRGFAFSYSGIGFLLILLMTCQPACERKGVDISPSLAMPKAASSKTFS